MRKIFVYFLAFVLGINSMAQENVGIGTFNPHPSAALDASGDNLTEKKGLLLPRVNLTSTTDISTIPNPAEGLVVFNLTAAGIGNSAVSANTYYYWDGTKWTDLGDINMVKNILLPQVFFIAETTGQNTVVTGSNINLGEVTLNFSPSSVLINTGNNVVLTGIQNFRIFNSGTYEISGYINYNPSIGLNQSTNLEYVIQVSTDGGSTWNDIAKTTMVWGVGTGANSRTNAIAPIVVSLNQNNIIRCVVRKSYGEDHGTNAGIRASVGMTYSKLLKIQKLD